MIKRRRNYVKHKEEHILGHRAYNTVPMTPVNRGNHPGINTSYAAVNTVDITIEHETESSEIPLFSEMKKGSKFSPWKKKQKIERGTILNSGFKTEDKTVNDGEIALKDDLEVKNNELEEPEFKPPNDLIEDTKKEDSIPSLNGEEGSLVKDSDDKSALASGLNSIEDKKDPADKDSKKEIETTAVQTEKQNSDSTNNKKDVPISHI